PMPPPSSTEPAVPDLVPFAPIPEMGEPQPAAPVAPGYTPNEVIIPEGASLAPALIFYPTGRTVEAKTVADKVERITPKFTKVTVALNVQSMAPYDPKADLKGAILAQLTPVIKSVFILVYKSLEDARR